MLPQMPQMLCFVMSLMFQQIVAARAVKSYLRPAAAAVCAALRQAFALMGIDLQHHPYQSREFE